LLVEGVMVAEKDGDGKSDELLILLTDVTKRERLQAELRHSASHDSLTGLSNRISVECRLEHAVAQANRDKVHAALLVIDLDGFKAVNDTYGHAAGDQLLIHVARQLKGAVRAVDTVGRVGGDEFVVIVEDLVDPLAIDMIAKKVLAAICLPMSFEQAELVVSASIGIALMPAHASRPRDLLEIADAAMYAAKRSGKNCIRMGDAIDAEGGLPETGRS
jgi:diguanylate cyclase (GGDEF)-like protein